MTNDDQPWTAFVRETLSKDDDWARHVGSLNPRIPLRKAIEDYVHTLNSRAAVTPQDIETAELILAAMRKHGFDTVDAFFVAVERGDVNLTDGAPASNRADRLAPVRMGDSSAPVKDPGWKAPTGPSRRAPRTRTAARQARVRTSTEGA